MLETVCGAVRKFRIAPFSVIIIIIIIVKLAISLSHSIISLGQPVLALTLSGQAPGQVESLV